MPRSGGWVALVALIVLAPSAAALPVGAYAAVTNGDGGAYDPAGRAKDARILFGADVDTDGDGATDHRLAYGVVDLARLEPGAGTKTDWHAHFYDEDGREVEVGAGPPTDALRVRGLAAEMHASTDGNATNGPEQHLHAETPRISP